jgi:hypothetical protein
VRARPAVVACAVAALALFPASAGTGAPAQERTTSDRPDDVSGPQVHVLYVIPRDGEDRGLDTSGTISRTVDSWQTWLRRQTGGRILRADTFRGALDVSFFRLAASDADVAARGQYVREQLEAELYAAGYTSAGKMYAVYYDGSSTWSCGGADPEPAVRGNFSALYLKGAPPGAPPCASNRLGLDPPGYLEFAMLHELVHSLGFVPRCAPHARGDYEAGHVSDSPFDLMWSGSEPWRTDRPDEMQLDVGRDDYYAHGRSGCPDLASSPYLVDAPEVPAPPAEPGRVEVVSFTTSRAATPGRVFRATLTLNQAVGRATCRATLNGRALRAATSVQSRSARCSWALPRSATGRLRGNVAATTSLGSASRSFSARVSRR